MTNILKKIIEEKKYSLDLLKKEKSLDILEKNIKHTFDILWCLHKSYYANINT